MKRPTVTAEHVMERSDERTLICQRPIFTPGVELRVVFTLGNEQEALAALDQAVADVREQIHAVDFAAKGEA